MKKLLLLIALLPFAALADDRRNDDNATQLQGQAQGQLQGQAQGNFNAVSVDNDVRNTANSASVSGANSRSISGALSGSASQAGSSSEQSQSVSVAEGAVQNSTATSTDQTQSATATNAGNAQSMTYNEAEQRRLVEVRSVPTAIAPNVYPTASCAMSASVGASALGWGVSGGGTKVNEECMQLEAARMFSQLGFTSQGLALACSTKSALSVFQSQAACIQYGAGSTAASAAVAPVATAQPVKVEATVPFGEVK